MQISRRSFLAGSAASVGASALPLPIFAAERTNLSPAQLRADLDLFQRAYETVHPGLLRYLPAGGFTEQITKARKWAEQERSLPDLYIMLARLTASIRCGHTHPNPYNQSRPVRAALFSGRDRLPFAFRWIDGQMIVTGARGKEAALPRGTRITSVDGVATSTLLRAMLPLARADGNNDAKRIAQLGIASKDRFATFDIFRPMLFPIHGEGTVRLRTISPMGAEGALELAALTEQEIQTARPADDQPLDWTFDIRSDGVGLLTMGDWTTYRSKWDWKAFLDASVDRLIDERARGLIIDIRGNEGGTECGWHLLERLIAKDLPLPRFNKKIRYRALPTDLNPRLDTWDDRFRDWGAAAEGPDSKGFYRLIGASADQEKVSPRGRRFSGAVAVLVDASCSSATFQFANAISGQGIATLVGEPTGGNRRGINGDAYFFVRLPETGLEVDLPIVGIFSADPQPDAGIIPDRLISMTAKDIVRGLDRQLAAALSLVGGRAVS